MAEARKRPTGRPSLARAAEIGDSIITVTLELLSEHGIDFSMDQVAATAGISKQAIYRRWPSKTDLVVHVIDRQIEDVIDRAQVNLPDDPHAAVREVAWRIFDEDSKFASRMAIFVQIEGMRNEPLRMRFVRWSQLLLSFIGDHIARTSTPPLDEDTSLRLAGVLQDMLVGARNRATWLDPSDASAKELFDHRWDQFTILMTAAAAARQR